MAPSTSTKSASEQLAIAIAKEYQLFQIVELHKLDYQLFHNQIHFFDQQIRKQTRSNGPLQQQMMEYLHEKRALAASNLVHRRVKWTEYVGKNKVSRRRIKELENLIAIEQRAVDLKAAEYDDDDEEEEASSEEEVEDDDDGKNEKVAHEAGAEKTVADEAAAMSIGISEGA